MLGIDNLLQANVKLNLLVLENQIEGGMIALICGKDLLELIPIKSFRTLIVF